jgi:hypothetical protein
MAIGTESLNTIILAGMPPHRLAFKVGIPIILLKNLDVTSWDPYNHLALGTEIDCHTNHWWQACREYFRHHHNSNPFKVAIHPIKVLVPLAIGIRYDH